MSRGPTQTTAGELVEGAEIVCDDGAVGSVYTVLRDPVTDEPTHIVFRQGVTLTKEVTIPVKYVSEANRSTVRLNVGKRKVDEMPQFWW
jgi:hypothetical protein